MPQVSDLLRPGTARSPTLRMFRLTELEPATPLEDPVGFQSPPIVPGTRGFLFVCREASGSLGTSVASWQRFLAND